MLPRAMSTRLLARVDLHRGVVYRGVMGTLASMERQEYVGAAELLDLLGVGRTRLATLTGQADFPKPAIILRMGSIWTFDDVAAWAERKGRTLNLDVRTTDVQADDDSTP